MESSQTEQREMTNDEFLINLVDLGFQRIEKVFEFWFEILTVGHKGIISSLFRFAKMSNRLELDIFFYSFALEVYRIEEK